uniref:Uncharacterized protein n=1 Tax=Zea mays TaxID=4577 RepID=C0P2T0_MAIZE|nr:unknown [Zea mays]
MINCLIFLFTKGTTARSREISLSQSIQCPTSIVDHKADEESAPRRSPNLLDTIKSLLLQGSLEDGCISRGC